MPDKNENVPNNTENEEVIIPDDTVNENADDPKKEEEDTATLAENIEDPAPDISAFHARRVLIVQNDPDWALMGVLLDVPYFTDEGYLLMEPAIIDNPWTSSTSLEQKISQALEAQENKIDLSIMSAADMAFLIKEAIDMKRMTAIYQLPSFIVVPYNKINFIYVIPMQKVSPDEETEATDETETADESDKSDE